MRPGPILLIEDTASLRLYYAATLRSAGHEVTLAANAAEALAAFDHDPPAVVLMDLALPDGDGLELMRGMLKRRPGLPIIIVTANGSIGKTVEAMRAGAHDYLVKPLDEGRLVDAAAHALGLPDQTPDAGQDATRSADRHTLVGRSAAIQAARDQIRAAARSMANVFITGECGTGKELCARAIHDQSARAQGPFVPLNCDAIPREVLETEIFGYGAGSAGRPGAAINADGGTLFLDEVCALDAHMQTRLLGLVRSMTVQAAGAPAPRKVNIRIICATSSDPARAADSGEFNRDLFYRLHVLPIRMPPLRERRDDILDIAAQALSDIARREARQFTAISDGAARALLACPWPGNVRQLVNAIWQSVVMNDGPVLTEAMLPSAIARGAAARPPAPDSGALSLGGLIGRPLADIERLVIERTILTEDGSITRAARVLNVAPSTLYRKIESWSGRSRQD